MHCWGDPGVDWKGIGAAADFIGDYLRRWGRVNVSCTKEKFGTVRVYCILGWYSLSCITHPGHSFVRYRRGGILWRLNYHPVVMSLVSFCNHLVVPWHRFLYRRSYKLAIKRWPHLRTEILNGADYNEYLEGL